MPLPWKKAGISRISRLMADLHPTKPCLSMVVQTGFPASLVDLFVKNCDRLKKPIKNKNKKKRHHRHHRHHQSPAVVDFSVSDPVDSSGGSGEEKDHHPVNLNNNFQFKTKVNFDCNKSIGRFESHDENIRGGFDSGCNRNQRGVLYAIFMGFVLLILALISIKILTLGITMSACVLIFVEYIGKQIFQLPVCSNFVRFKAAFWVFLCKEDKREIITESKEEEREDEQEEDDDEEEDSIELNSPVEEIEVAEARFDAIARGELDNNGTRMNLSPGRWGYSDIEVEEEEEDDECEVTAPEKQHSRPRRSSREFMKKFVPKKWRAMKKARKGRKENTEEYASSELSSSHSSEDKLARNEEIEELYNNSESKGRITFLIEEENKMSLENAVEFEKSYKKEKEVIKKERKKSQRGSAFMLLVALAGLVGGRILALGLTVISCVIIQLVTARRGRNPKAMC